MHPRVVHAEQHFGAKALLNFKVPLVICRLFECAGEPIQAGWDKSGHGGLDALQRSSVGELCSQNSIGLGCRSKEAVRDTRSNGPKAACCLIALNSEHIYVRCLDARRTSQLTRQLVSEYTSASPNHGIAVRSGFPGDSQARFINNRLGIRECVMLVEKDGLVIRNIRIDRIAREWRR